MATKNSNPCPSDVQVNIRLSPDLLSRVDEYAARLAAQTPGLRVSRASAIRSLIEKGLREA